jgi:hypothetical protein
MPETDLKRAPIQVVLDMKDRGQSMQRQSKAPHGCASQELPAFLFRDQEFPHLHDHTLGIVQMAFVETKVIPPAGRRSGLTAVGRASWRSSSGGRSRWGPAGRFPRAGCAGWRTFGLFDDSVDVHGPLHVLGERCRRAVCCLDDESPHACVLRAVTASRNANRLMAIEAVALLGIAENLRRPAESLLLALLRYVIPGSFGA